MKHFLLLGLFLSSTAWGLEVRVKGMRLERGMDRSFALKTSLSEKVVLDCQSFIQGLRFGEREQAVVFMLDSEECEALAGRMRTSLDRGRQHCVEVDHDIRSDETCP